MKSLLRSPNSEMGGDDWSVENPHDDEAQESGRVRPRKSAAAFRTISEVADELNVPQHVLRFWETRFPRIKPLKRGGGRRYYRPDDVALLRRISNLLYIQGYTIKGVQRLLKESGGTLLGEIPPPSPEEQAAAAAEQVRERSVPVPAKAPQPAPTPPPAIEARESAAEMEVKRLHGILLELLDALEALRGRLH